MPSQPVQRDGVWWIQRDDGVWMRWHEGAWWIPRSDGTWTRWDEWGAAGGAPHAARGHHGMSGTAGAQQYMRQPQQPTPATPVQQPTSGSGPLIALICGLVAVVAVAGYFLVFSGKEEDGAARAGGSARATPTRTVAPQATPTRTGVAGVAPTQPAPTQIGSVQPAPTQPAPAATQPAPAQAVPTPAAPATSAPPLPTPTQSAPAPAAPPKPAAGQPAAARPDFQTGFFPFKSTYAPGETISFSVIYAMNGQTNGPVEVVIDFPNGIGEPRETMNFGFTCNKQAGASAQGGWRWTCTKPELFDGGEQMTLSMSAPTAPGEFTFKTTITPVGTTDRDDSDNAAEMTLTVK